ncbi:hypothetical protein NM688_g7344 [Phlebia brevispora]|uniref:Uncharacterized protein n=1 Tax=Phlebia brevispora TaxID=194682 RepID=A0ACC1S6H0_9APHY|nr:hypothetical protein NM688_g7344 [Phlebia brevispora]
MYSGRLTSIPSARSPHYQESPTSKSVTKPLPVSDVLSPASRYSPIKPPSLKPPVPPVDRLSIPGQTRSLFIQPPVVQQTAIPRASELRMAVEQEARISGLQEQLASVQRGLEKLPQELDAVVGEHSEHSPPVASTSVDQESKQVLRAIDNSVKRIEDQAQLNAQGLTGVHAKIEQLFGLHSQLSAMGKDGSPGPIEISVIATRLEEIRAGLTNDLPLIAQKLEDLLSKVSSDFGGEAKMSNIPPSDQRSGSSDDATAIHSKLDNLLAIYQAAQDDQSAKAAQEDNTKMQEMLDILKGDQAQRTQQLEQQADNARYLNELNTWLETFVAHGTSQIDTVVAGVQQLCKELGPVPELNQIVGPDGQPVQQEGSSLLSDVRRLLIESKDRGDGASMLHESVNGMMAAMQDELRRNAESQNAFTTESIAAMIGHQRQDQEQMLRTLASELSNEIRGERLRFVEAMKEATTINVQIHVEEFKKELTREVLAMTSEVARLHRERQSLEQHIADLFAFYAKQKQNGVKSSQQPPRQQRQQPPLQGHYPPVVERGASSRGHRPLPNPMPRGMPGG